MIDVYQEILKFLYRWCKTNYYTNFIVRLKIDNEVRNYYVEFDSEMFALIFEDDFYEGQDYIELIGFIPVDDVTVHKNVNIVIKGRNLYK